jgi:ABC-type antimicrobial peptide transport system permease subunit
MYVPLEQIDRADYLGHMSYVVRTAESASAVAPAMREVLRGADANLPPGTISTMDQVVVASLGDRLFQTRILGVFAVLALLLAAVGVYGVTAYSVNERTQELGIRMALGARAEQVAKMTLVGVLRLVIPGLLLGSVAAVAAGRLIRASLYEVTPGDPLTLVGVVLLLGAVAIIAALVPTRRAIRINLVEVLSA